MAPMPAMVLKVRLLGGRPQGLERVKQLPLHLRRLLLLVALLRPGQVAPRQRDPKRPRLVAAMFSLPRVLAVRALLPRLRGQWPLGRRVVTQVGPLWRQLPPVLAVHEPHCRAEPMKDHVVLLPLPVVAGAARDLVRGLWLLPL